MTREEQVQYWLGEALRWEQYAEVDERIGLTEQAQKARENAEKCRGYAADVVVGA